jgi:arylformamidase
VGQARRDQYVAGWAERSDAVRKTRRGRIDVRYGDGERQRLDVFPCGTPAAPTLVYIHGGYWQMNDKEPYAFLGEGLLPAGFNLALVEYTLAPAARLDAIVAEIRAAVDWVIAHAKEIGGDPGRVFVAGHSAGGHLTAMAMYDDRVAGGVAISGIYDLEPIRLNYLNEKLGLDPTETDRNSPIRHLPSAAAPLVVTVGLGELPELIRQSEEYARAWQQRGLRGRYLPLAKHDHFSILEELAQPGGAILKSLKELAY